MPHLDEFVSLAFEDVARGHVWRLAISGQLPFVPDRVGTWWDKDTEIDIVAVGDDGLLLGECKWSARAVGVGVLDDLKRAGGVLLAKEPRLRDAPPTHVRPVTYAVFSRAGFTAELRQMAEQEQILLVEASDLRCHSL